MKNISIVSGMLILLLFGFFLNPFNLWMPTELEYLMASALAVVAALFAGLVMGEKARDEREEALRAHAARAGYLAGIFVLTLSIAVTILSGEKVDEWVVIAFAVMVLVRLFVRARVE